MEEDLDRLGLIFGPSEDPEDYRKRIRQLLQGVVPLPGGAPLTSDQIGCALDRTDRLYDIRPSWVRGVISNKGLAPWHAGCAYTGLDRQGQHYFWIQVRKTLMRGLVKREELIAHELCHAARMAFPDGPFEEIFAYRTSGRLRRVLGPLMTKASEPVLLLALVFASLAMDLLAPSPLSLCFKCLPLGLLGFFSLRLAVRHRTLRRCIERLAVLSPNPWPIAFRLSDAEVRRFSRLAPCAILAYAKRRAQGCARWSVIVDSYLTKGATCDGAALRGE